MTRDFLNSTLTYLNSIYSILIIQCGIRRKTFRSYVVDMISHSRIPNCFCTVSVCSIEPFGVSVELEERYSFGHE